MPEATQLSRMPSGATFQAKRAERGERIRFFTAAGGEPGRVFRACTVFDHELGTQRIVELCGHAFCSNEAPASPGSRCADHLGDPVPDGCGPDHWLHLAGEADHAEDEHGVTLEWWQMQEHLPERPLARCGDERRGRDMYEPLVQCDDCDY
ncbi:hypothetical protein ACIOHA_21950 [Streptomyces anulatus]